LDERARYLYHASGISRIRNSGASLKCEGVLLKIGIGAEERKEAKSMDNLTDISAPT
jgi:hypothetical protein